MFLLQAFSLPRDIDGDADYSTANHASLRSYLPEDLAEDLNREGSERLPCLAQVRSAQGFRYVSGTAHVNPPAQSGLLRGFSQALLCTACRPAVPKIPSDEGLRISETRQESFTSFECQTREPFDMHKPRRAHGKFYGEGQGHHVFGINVDPNRSGAIFRTGSLGLGEAICADVALKGRHEEDGLQSEVFEDQGSLYMIPHQKDPSKMGCYLHPNTRVLIRHQYCS